MYLNEDKTKLFSRDSNEVSAAALAAKRDRKKNNFPFSIFNARKIIFTIIAAFSTIKTVLFALWRAPEDEKVARLSGTGFLGAENSVFERLGKLRRHQLSTLF